MQCLDYVIKIFKVLDTVSQFKPIHLLTVCFLEMQCNTCQPFLDLPSSFKPEFNIILFLFFICHIHSIHSDSDFYCRKCLGNTTSRFQNCAANEVWPLCCFIWGEYLCFKGKNKSAKLSEKEWKESTYHSWHAFAD